MRSAVIYNFLIEANIMASIAILLMIPLRKLLRKQLGNSALCFGWLLTAVRLLCPLSLPNPFIHEIRPAYVYDMTIRPIAGQIKIRLIDAITDLGTAFWRAGNQQAANEMQKAAVGVDYNGYPAILAWIWMAVCILVLLWFVFRNIQFRKALKDNRIEEISGELKEMYLQLCEERNVTPVPVYFTDPVPGACLVGILKPYIVLPVITAPKDVKNVLIHEICHLKNKDQIWGILRLLCCAIHWFNPLVWLAASMSRTDCELRCDDRVTAPMDEAERKDYANVLVLATARRNMPGIGVMATGMTMTGKRLKNRVMAIVQTRKPIRIFAGVFMIFAFACLIGAFATSEISRSWLTSFPDNSEQTEWTLDAEMLKYYATDQEALDAYGTGVWLSPSLKEEDIRTPFTVQHNEAETEWRIADKDEGLMLVFDGNGVLTNLLNGRSNVDDSVPVPLENQDTPMHKLADIYSENLDEGVLKYFNSFLGSFRPDLVSERNYVQLIEQWQKNDTYFAVFALRTMVLNEQGVLEKEDLYPAMIELEMYPEIRVVRLTTVPDQMINPGNG
jgi:beta-lactamase regulating signal transducer with metallopeptidase domain